MSDNTPIEWTDATWNPITGCSVVSKGCTNCYAMRLAGTRLQHHPSRAGLTRDSKAGPVWTGEVRFNEDWLDQPLQWRKPRRIFVCAHGDLFHPGVPTAWIHRIFRVMQDAPVHTFQVLTKRPERMRAYIKAYRPAPLPNVWLGTSVEDQDAADLRLPVLADTPAAVRWVSAEPLLGPIDMSDYLWGSKFDGARPLNDVHWVVAGGESGPNARPMHQAWLRSLRDQCHSAMQHFFFKQWGAWLPGHHYTEALQDLDPDPQQSRYLSAELEPCGWSIGRRLACETGPEALFMVGARNAGRNLDGRTHDDYPAPLTTTTGAQA